VDGYMNIALEKCEEHVNGVKKRSYGDAFVRGNNGEVGVKDRFTETFADARFSDVYLSRCMMGTIYRHRVAMTKIYGQYTWLLLTLVHG
jgi:hypothetical protein